MKVPFLIVFWFNYYFAFIGFALLSPLVPSLARYLGNEKALFAGLLILALGIVVRSIPMVGSLFVGTLLIGVGIVVGNVCYLH